MADELLPIDPEHLDTYITIEPGERLHRLLARLIDTHVDDLREEFIVDLERKIDQVRVTHGDGSAFGSKSHD
ncbi:hypothetical protein [Mesorhizobium sp. B1-1-5]|uniref:hypothetical protein n=1 Tax=Mesorhizobium sp. B1-1-5 TaxID=2589979 RepID=UPI001126F6B5|nr:hypothetical protein [Mesorhizobium sp. B1-1-5]TPN74489.1 hypothetical protein FJ980_31775 [Mesorhizobium sp. B1-1-5]